MIKALPKGYQPVWFKSSTYAKINCKHCLGTGRLGYDRVKGILYTCKCTLTLTEDTNSSPVSQGITTEDTSSIKENT